MDLFCRQLSDHWPFLVPVWISTWIHPHHSEFEIQANVSYKIKLIRNQIKSVKRLPDGALASVYHRQVVIDSPILIHNPRPSPDEIALGSTC
jgi:hypothetical protein